MSIVRYIYQILFGDVDSVVRIHVRVMLSLKNKGWMVLARWVERRMQRKYSVFLSPYADVDKSILFKHPVGIVIGRGVKIGSGVIIYQNVTIGGARVGDGKKNLYPSIGNNTIIFAGAVILGDIVIGSNCIVGANAVVTKDVPDNSTVAGVPAKILQPRRS